MKKSEKYIPLYTKDKKIFYKDDNIIKQILENKEDDRLTKIMTEVDNIQDTNDIKNYVSSLGLEEA